MNQTPKSNRLHIGIFGISNAGKSTILNDITGQESSLVSEIKGTTTDPVYKNMELFEVGPVVFIDTAGFNDGTDLGLERERKTLEVMQKIDIGIYVIRDNIVDYEKIKELKKKNKPILAVFNADFNINTAQILKNNYNIDSILYEKEKLRQEIKRLSQFTDKEQELVTRLVSKEDIVLLVMPQDLQAPKGRLILPQVQTIRNLLDNHCIVVAITKEQLKSAIN